MNKKITIGNVYYYKGLTPGLMPGPKDWYPIITLVHVPKDESSYVLSCTTSSHIYNRNPDKFFTATIIEGKKSYIDISTIYKIGASTGNTMFQPTCIAKLSPEIFVELAKAFYDYQIKKPHKYFARIQPGMNRIITTYECSNFLIKKVRMPDYIIGKEGRKRKKGKPKSSYYDDENIFPRGSKRVLFPQISQDDLDLLF